MTKYSVYKLVSVGTRQLLLVTPDEVSWSLCVYDEHTSTTIMRLSDCSLESFKLAISCLESDS